MESVNKIKSLVSSQAEKTKADTFDPQFFWRLINVVDQFLTSLGRGI